MDWEFFESKYPELMSSLKRARNADRLAHAHLVVSANPEIRQSFPPILASLAACQSRLPGGAPCKKCPTCRQMLSGTYPEIYLLAPTSKSRQIVVGEDAEDADTLRWFESRFYLASSTSSGWKVGIVQDADRMNENAQNAFLKTLEEPPRNCLFVLTTGSPSELLPTIRSRCQTLPLTDNKCQYKFPRCEELPAVLMELQTKARGDIDKAGACADKLIEIAASLQAVADETIDKKWEPLVLSAKESLESSGMKIIDRRIAGEAASEYKRMREQFTSMIHTWFAQALLLASGTPSELLPNPEIMEPLLKAQGEMPEADASKRLSMAERLLRSLQTNVNDELALRAFCLNVALK